MYFGFIAKFEIQGILIHLYLKAIRHAGNYKSLLRFRLLIIPSTVIDISQLFRFRIIKG